ncbi:hypothetical protein [Agromyces sp. SYSU T00194]|uniref:hypothetical protein n=1 Tax=Agromyces chitinivorans TaxID=3158560 RepID=UPI0033942AA6
MTKTLIHHSPAGALEIVGVLGAVPPGQPFDVDDKLADSLLASALYEEVTVIDGVALDTLKPAELRALATEHGVDVPKRASKAELLELIHAADLPVLGEPDDHPAAQAADAAPAADQQGENQ